MNLVKIATACAVECERQQVGLVELGYLIKAYTYVQFNGLGNESIFQLVGRTVEPLKNQHGLYRITPVTFQNGGSSANASAIPRLMEQLVENIAITSYNRNETEARYLTREFLWIHPFADGNGRISFLLLNYLLGTLDDPLALPDFGW